MNGVLREKIREKSEKKWSNPILRIEFVIDKLQCSPFPKGSGFFIDKQWSICYSAMLKFREAMCMKTIKYLCDAPGRIAEAETYFSSMFVTAQK